MIVAGDGMNLGFSPEAPECARKNDPVMVLVERTAPKLFGTRVRFAKAFAIKQGVPIQGAVLRK